MLAQGCLLLIQPSRVRSGMRGRMAPSVPSLVEYKGGSSGRA